jgi:hypothetical protein
MLGGILRISIRKNVNCAFLGLTAFTIMPWWKQTGQ